MGNVCGSQLSHEEFQLIQLFPNVPRRFFSKRLVVFRKFSRLEQEWILYTARMIRPAERDDDRLSMIVALCAEVPFSQSRDSSATNSEGTTPSTRQPRRIPTSRRERQEYLGSIVPAIVQPDLTVASIPEQLDFYWTTHFDDLPSTAQLWVLQWLSMIEYENGSAATTPYQVEELCGFARLVGLAEPDNGTHGMLNDQDEAGTRTGQIVEVNRSNNRCSSICIML